MAIYEAVKHFRHMLEACHFTILTDHEPITYAFQQKRDKSSPHQFNHLNFACQFMTDIRHISGQDNVVADALSRVESVTASPSYDASQDGDELRTLLGSNTTLRLEKLPIPCTTVSIYCDTSAGRPRLYIPAPVWLQVFQSVQQRQSWSNNASYDRVCGRIAAPGHVLVSPASAQKSPVTW
jgi:cleavage and polyadenylation specificity factor subunit 1